MKRSKQSGFSILEVLIALTIVSIAAYAFSGSFKSSQEKYAEKHQLADVHRHLVMHQLRAVEEATIVRWEPMNSACDPQQIEAVLFFPDGSVSGPTLCIADTRYFIDPITASPMEVN